MTNVAGIAGPLSGFTVTNIHDSLLRRVTNGVWNGSAWVTLLTNAYDFAGRLSLVSDRTNAAGYTYVSKSPLISQIQFTNAGQLRVTESRTYDFLNRLTKIESVNAQPATLASFAYAYNSANQRTSITNMDNSRWNYGYDTLGQVTSGKRAWSDGSAVAGQQFEYGFDDIGNRKFAASGGDQWGANLRYQNYTATLLNQYTQRTVPGSVNVIGAANSNATVTVNLQPTTRKNEYFRGEVNVDNSAAALWLGLTNVAVLPNGTNADIVTTNTGYAFLPRTPEAFNHDADGNLTNDGRFFYTWDGENRLTKVESQTSAPTASKRRLMLEYTGQGRLIRLTEYNGSSGSYVVTNDLKLANDGWQCIAELNATNNAVVRSYMWGLDLSGTRTGAGGVGGLLGMKSVASGVHFYLYDGNGNVAALASATNGAVTAQYEYEPFGAQLRATGPMATENVFGFSTKRRHEAIDLILYEYRPYSAPLGRWLSRDPIVEKGGPNVYGYVFNRPIAYVDLWGLSGVLFIHYSCGNWRESSHVWIEFFSDAGEYETYGLRFTPGKGIGLTEGKEVSYIPDASRGAVISDEEEIRLREFISDEAQTIWRWRPSYNCANFGLRAWYIATGENLEPPPPPYQDFPPTGPPFVTPGDIQQWINQANSGAPQFDIINYTPVGGIINVNTPTIFP